MATVLGGAGDRINIVPQSFALNRGAWRDMEKELQGLLKDGKSISMKIDIPYPSKGGPRPNEFLVTAIVDGIPKTFPVFKQ
ncbi:DNA/RNA non-specific endonuclease [Roseateles chitinivorans]|uniref:DNA/RNA non-specific endonuclease n=1 Tax=Roseateles chitinivorans TaxID=2917965 RepID=UPI0034A2AA4E